MHRSLRLALLWSGVAVLLLVVPFVVWNRWTQRELAAAKERLDAARLPSPLPAAGSEALPPEQNAEPEIAQLQVLAESAAFTQGASVDSTLSAQLAAFTRDHPELHLDAASIAELSALLSVPVIAEMHALGLAAAAKGYYDPQLDYRRGAELHVPQISAFRAIAGILREHARLAAARGDFEAARADVAAIFTLTEFSASPPILISQMLGFVSLNTGLAALEQLASAGGLDAAGARQFSARLAAIAPRAGLVRSLDAERIFFGSAAFEKIVAGSGPHVAAALGADRDALWLNLAPAGYFRLEYAAYLDQARVFRQALARSTGSAEKHLQRFAALNTLSAHPVAALVVPNLQPLATRMMELEARLVVARVGLGVLQFQLQHGRVPATLAELVPELLPAVPADPMQGQPLLYVRTGATAIVYSVGKNFRDDGGKSTRDGPEDDLAWRHEPAEPKR